MSRTIRADLGFNKGRCYGKQSLNPKCEPDSKHPKGFNTFLDDGGMYSPKATRELKRMSNRARRIYSDNVLKKELECLSKET